MEYMITNSIVDEYFKSLADLMDDKKMYNYLEKNPPSEPKQTTHNSKNFDEGCCTII
jgi:hypothetical protein